MTLQLNTVPASRGPRWVAEAFRLFARKPLLFTMMFAVFPGETVPTRSITPIAIAGQ